MIILGRALLESAGRDRLGQVVCGRIGRELDVNVFQKTLLSSHMILS